MSGNLSNGTRMSIPFSAPTFSAPTLPSEEPDQVRATWGTTVNIAETVKLFGDFLRGFKPKYAIIESGTFAPAHFLLQKRVKSCCARPTYQLLRQTSQTNLNLDMVNLLAHPSSKMLFTTIRDPTIGKCTPGIGEPGGAEDPEFEDGIAGGHRWRTRKAELDAELIEINGRHDVYDYLALSLVPSTRTMSRRAFCFSLRGGGGGDPRYRGDINVLLVGDPAASISQVLQCCSGALVLSDGGVCCIDEFDMALGVYYMESWNNALSIAKAGIITTLNARTSILAAANPVESTYNVPLAMPFWLGLSMTFRYVYGALFEVVQIDALYPLEDLAAYIDYSRNHINPVLSSEASDELVAAYVSLRSVGASDPRSSEKRITTTTRQLESTIRLSEAHARMRFAAHVEAQDVQEACRLMCEDIRTSAMDPRKGKIDMGLPDMGTRTGGTLAILEGSGGKSKGIRWGEAIKRLAEQSTIGVDAAEYTEVIKLPENEGLP
ncbi:MCM2/3/5 family-domain-containing protein [Pisolithus albus]|nr:MCM2/3/5 family-domain-containing protein [Pisolithus albus]